VADNAQEEATRDGRWFDVQNERPALDTLARR
jgi:hypothetical protein